MHDFTVVTCVTPSYQQFVSDLEADCRLFGYPLYCKRLRRPFRGLKEAFDYKISFFTFVVCVGRDLS